MILERQHDEKCKLGQLDCANIYTLYVCHCNQERYTARIATEVYILHNDIDKESILFQTQVKMNKLDLC